MKLVVGLGNPGKKYEHNRHNVGFQTLDSIAESWTLMARCSALICKEKDVIFAKPQTYMNLSGAAVVALLNYYKIEQSNLLVVYDDKDLEFGTIRFRKQGSSAGHNGMNSIIGSLGSEEFSRLRFGIAPADPAAKIFDTADFVLQDFTAEEEKELPALIQEAKRQILDFAQ